jgi:hypothetical protein
MGIDDEINTLDKLATNIKKVIKKNEYENVCFLGNSMGGFAAILFGLQNNVKKIISFAPQTYIDRLNRLVSIDFRWKKQLANVHKFKGNRILDLKPFVAEHINSKTQIDIYYSSKHRLDRIHAERLRGFQNVTLYPFSLGGHAVVKIMRDEGKLVELIKHSFESEK